MEQKKTFQKSIDNIVAKILEDNGLKENLKDYLNKIDQGVNPYFDILYRLINNFTIERINETSFLSSTQKELNTSEQTAKNILKEVKEKILPLVITISEDEIEKQDIVAVKINDISAAPIKKIKKRIPEIEEKEIKTVIPQSQQKSKDDRYREPIE